MGNLDRDVLHQWRMSSIYDKKRLEILKNITTKDHEKLCLSDEQEGFNLESNEFLLYVHKCTKFIPKILVFILHIFIFFYIILFVYLKFHEKTTNIEFIRNNADYLWTSGGVFVILCVSVLVYFSKCGNLLITNKGIYLDNIQKKRVKIEFNGLSIKNEFSVYYTKGKNSSNLYYRAVVLFFSGQNCKQCVSLKDINNGGFIYILEVISYIVDIYNYVTYIYPIRCGTDYRKSEFFQYIPMEYNFFIFFEKIVKHDEYINIKFSSKEKLISFIKMRGFENGISNKKELICALSGSKIIESELLFTVDARENILSRCTIFVYKTYIQVIYKKEILKIKIGEYQDRIFNTNRAFIFIFQYRGNDIIISTYKEQLDIPLLEILETISGVSIPYYRSFLFIESWIS